MKIKTLKNISFLLLIWGFLCHCHAQQEAQFTQYMFNKMSYNPGYTGTSGSICLTGLYRDQWMGLALDGPIPNSDAGVTPRNFLFTFDMPISFLHGGIGATILSDQVGYTSSTTINVDYAYHFYWGPGTLALGFEAGILNSTINSGGLVGADDLTGNPANPTGGSSSDPLISNSLQSDMLTDFSFGLFYQVAGKAYAGLAMKNLLASKSNVLNIQNSRCVYFMGGGEYALPTSPSYRIMPSALIKTADFSVYQIDLSCLVEYQRAFWCGMSYRVNDAIAVLAGVNWNKLRIGMSYDFTTSTLGGISKEGRSKGSMELYLRYCFKVIIPPKPPSSYQNTRYLL